MWEERPYIINRLNSLGVSGEELKDLSYEQRWKSYRQKSIVNVYNET